MYQPNLIGTNLIGITFFRLVHIDTVLYHLTSLKSLQTLSLEIKFKGVTPQKLELTKTFVIQ